jgi:hypothetical protein
MFVCFFILSIFYCPKKQDQVQVLSFYSINRLPVGEVNDISSTKHLTLFHILVYKEMKNRKQISLLSVMDDQDCLLS